MAGVNKVILVGIVANDPIVTQTNTMNVVRFTITTSFQTKDGKEIKDYSRCVAFGKAADYAASLRQGDLVSVEGSLKSSSYEKDGIKQYKTEVAVSILAKLAESVPIDSTQDIPF